MEDPELMDVQIENGEGVNYLTDFEVMRLYATIMECTVEEARDWLRNPAGLNRAIIRPCKDELTPQSGAESCKSLPPQPRIHVAGCNANGPDGKLGRNGR